MNNSDDIKIVGPWSLIDDIWVAYQKDLNEEATRQPNKCPSCGNYSESDDSIINIYEEGKSLHGTCGMCRAHLAIIIDDKRV